MSLRRSSFLFLSCVMTLSAHAQSADEIIAKSLAARGGRDKIKAIQTERLTGHISLGENAEGPFVVQIKRGGKMRQEMTLDGKPNIRATDGVSGWALSGDGSLIDLSAGDIRNMAGGADIDGPLFDYQAKGNRVEYGGKEKVSGKDAYKLTVTLKDGQVRNEYIDCETNLGVKWSGKISNAGRDFDVDSLFSDYRKVDGVMFAFQIDSETIGTPYKQKITFDKVEVNPTLDDSLFQKPAQTAK
jgi:outer membrane lipoprotein-sorting protein